MAEGIGACGGGATEWVSVPQIDNPQAKAFLGAAGLLGPAGSGAQIWKSLGVTLGGPGSSAPPRINNQVGDCKNNGVTPIKETDTCD